MHSPDSLTISQAENIACDVLVMIQKGLNSTDLQVDRVLKVIK